VSEKTLEPTAARRRRARREGDLPRSHEIVAVASFAAALAAAAAAIPLLGELARAALIRAAATRSLAAESAELLALGGLALAPLGAALLAGTSAALAQGGLVVVAPALKLARLSPVEGARRIFSRETLAAAARSCATAALAALALAGPARALTSAAASAATAQSLAAAFGAALAQALLVILALGIAAALLDAILARRRWLRKLRMSVAEWRREHKEQDGDPHVRARRRSIHREVLRTNLRRVREAAVVITNPTHVAVALSYRPPDVAIPVVLLRALDRNALRVKELAREHGVPLVENVALARMLYATARPGEPIPPEAYLAVARIVALLGYA
jgi:flagellar biosynthesis protein FlhB